MRTIRIVRAEKSGVESLGNLTMTRTIQTKTLEVDVRDATDLAVLEKAIETGVTGTEASEMIVNMTPSEAETKKIEAETPVGVSARETVMTGRTVGGTAEMMMETDTKSGRRIVGIVIGTIAMKIEIDGGTDSVQKTAISVF